MIGPLSTGLLALAWTSCKGEDPLPPPDATIAAAVPDGVGTTGVRRLSRAEFDTTLRDLLDDATLPATRFLPEDVVDPFDNDRSHQQPSAVLVGGIEAMANDVAARLVADPDRLAWVLPCTPTGSADSDCLTDFVTSFGRLALRRPVDPEETAALVALGTAFATDVDDFGEGIDVVVRALLQHPAFVYRVEHGAPTSEDGVYRLDDHEVATRLSFFLWGSTPDTWLLDQAAAGLLSEGDDVRLVAEAMLSDPRARDRIDRFHAMWLGYWQLPHPPDLTGRFRAETRALVEDVVFDDPRPWLDLFTATETWLDDALADHYGLPRPGGAGWVDYGGSGRQGILSHGSFLSVNAKFGDTSPTLRGKLVRERLLCDLVPPPPPGVNVDEPPEATDLGDCKVDRYAAHRDSGACRSCHELVDPIGFGLEAFDQQGRFREHDVDAPECTITGEGDVDGQPFVGPAGLADLLVASDDLTDCAVEQTLRLAMGAAPTDYDDPLLQRLRSGFPVDDHRLDALILQLVGDDAFLFRREEIP